MSDAPALEPMLTGVRAPLRAVLETALEGRRLDDAQARVLAEVRGAEHPALWAVAARLRDRGRPPLITYSRKVFIPLTNLCRDICSYCTFAKLDTDPRAHTMSRTRSGDRPAGAARGCKEALFTLGDRPERRFESTDGRCVASARIDPLVSGRNVPHGDGETGLLPHPNAGIMGAANWPLCARSRPARG